MGAGNAALVSGTGIPAPAGTPSASTPAPSSPTPNPATPANTHVQTPEVKLVRFLQVPINDCESAVGSLFPTGTGSQQPDLLSPWKTQAACGFLVGATNPTPPASLRGDQWRRFVASKEFRGFIDVAPYNLYCTNGKVSNVIPENLRGGTSPGWTPVLLPVPHRAFRKVYEKGEYLNDPLYKGQSEEVRYTPQQDGAVVSVRVAARIAELARHGQYRILGVDAPFIWNVVHIKLGCNGTYQIVTSWSTIPRLAVYLDGRQVMTTQQGDLADFIGSGGSTFHGAGKGNLAPDCEAVTVAALGTVRNPVPSALDCRTARDTAGFDVPSDGTR